MRIERYVEQTLFASRWLLCPLYVGLGFLLIAFCVLFFSELAHVAAAAFAQREEAVILGALTLIDIALIAGLVVMVMLSGYENFISRLQIAETETTIAWLGKLDAGTLKLKVAASIVAISSVQLLRGFMGVDEIPNDKLILLVVIHLTFVISALLLTFMDRLAGAGRT
jgi:uncharacterized protein (TIGR00645 family)